MKRKIIAVTYNRVPAEPENYTESDLLLLLTKRIVAYEEFGLKATVLIEGDWYFRTFAYINETEKNKWSNSFKLTVKLNKG